MEFAKLLDQENEYQNNPTLFISKFAEKYGKAKLVEYLHLFFCYDSAEPSNAHISFAKLPFESVITTNFDSLLEKSYEKNGIQTNVIFNKTQLSINKLYRKILKIHGDLNLPDTI